MSQGKFFEINSDVKESVFLAKNFYDYVETNKVSKEQVSRFCHSNILALTQLENDINAYVEFAESQKPGVFNPGKLDKLECMQIYLPMVIIFLCMARLLFTDATDRRTLDIFLVTSSGRLLQLGFITINQEFLTTPLDSSAKQKISELRQKNPLLLILADQDLTQAFNSPNNMVHGKTNALLNAVNDKGKNTAEALKKLQVRFGSKMNEEKPEPTAEENEQAALFLKKILEYSSAQRLEEGRLHFSHT